jgi:cyclopropane fatty-acyl-phospholipid synthase-like methyltransferase
MPDTPPRDFDAIYREGTAPWDVGHAQPEIVKLAAEGEIVGDVLDVGCGSGENALHLASLGRRVVGVDASPTAIALAREKAAARGLAVPFFVGDAMDLGKLHRRFETGVDCGLFHVFGREERRAYAHSLTEVLSPGSTLHVLCFSDEEPPGPGPHRIAEYDFSEAFRSIFALTRIRPARFESRLHAGGAKAWLATLVRI